MFTYKIVSIKHSMWTGKAKENVEDIIHDFAIDGWRLVQIVESSISMWYSGSAQTKIIFEKPARDAKFSNTMNGRVEGLV